jgi:phage tail sheath protein FI
MPVAPTYPGVYIEEIPSGVRTITGVATSIAAFIGRALRGPVNKATTINSYGDFERIFGGLWVKSPLGYAVRDFFLNGGGQAIIVRLFHQEDPAATPTPPPSKTPLTAGNLTLEAAYEGKWGANLRFVIDAQVSEQVAQAMGLVKTDLFNLTVFEVGADGLPVRSEMFRNLSVVPSARRIDKVLKEEFNLVKWKGVWPPANLPDIAALHTAESDLATARQNLAAAQAAVPKVQATIDAAQTAVKVKQPALANLNTDNITKAEQQLADANKQLADANKALADANKQLAAAQAASPQVPADVTAAQTAVTTATTAVTAAQTAVTNAPAPLTAAKKTSDGLELTKADDLTPPNGAADKKGMYALEDADLFNLLCIPPYLVATGNVDPTMVGEAAAYCEKRRAMLVVDPPAEWKDPASAISGVGNVGTNSKNSALYFPRLTQPNPLRDNQMEDFVPCGAIAGVMARTDTQRGVWKAPAGLDATLVGVPRLSVPLTDAENGQLNPLGINCLRTMVPVGRVVWGARTLQGDDRLASEWKYVPVRRTALYIEESLYRGTQWVVFEPNDEPLWAQIRLNVGAFMHNLFRQGAFQGMTPKDAYFVKCDKETTTQNDINLGIVNIVVGFAPLKPAEFVIIKLQQMAGQIET